VVGFNNWLDRVKLAMRDKYFTVEGLFEVSTLCNIFVFMFRHFNLRMLEVVGRTDSMYVAHLRRFGNKGK